MKKKNKRSLLIITPVEHLSGFIDKAKKEFKLIKYLPDPTFDQLIKNIKNVNYIFTNPNMSKFKIDKKILDAGKNLKCICTASTGTNHIDLEYSKKKGIKIISLKKNIKILKKIPSTAELAFTLMMSSLRNIINARDSVIKYQWSYLDFIGEELKNKKIGVLGYGRLGKFFANFCLKFGAKVFFYDPFKNQTNKKIKRIKNINNFLRMIDILSIHIHLNQNTINFIDKKKLKLLKKNILIINTSRGEIINEGHLIEFMKKNKKSKFSADVISHELKNLKKSKLLKYFKENTDRIIITPHLGGSTIQAQSIAYFESLINLSNFDKNKNY